MIRPTFTTRLLAVLALSVALGLSTVDKAHALPVDSFFDIMIGGFEAGDLDFNATAITAYGGFDTEIIAMQLKSSPAPNVTTTGSLAGGDFQIDSFFDLFYTIDPDGPGGSDPFIIDSFFDIATAITIAPPVINPNGSRTFDTEILSMDLSGAVGSPSTSTVLGLSAALDHRGHVTVLKGPTAGPGGTPGFQIDSFFDVFTEISFDDGLTFNPAAGATPLAFSVSVAAPEPSTYVMGAMSLLALGLYGWRRKKGLAT